MVMSDSNDSPSFPPASSHSGAEPVLPDLPKPFATEPATPKLPMQSGGCGKLALLGCGVLIVLFGVGLIVFLMKADDALLWIFGKLETEITRGLPEDLSAADRTRLDRAFSNFYKAVETGEADSASLQRLQGKLMELAADIDSGLSHEQVKDLTLVLERAAGTEVEDDTEAPLEQEPAPEGILETTAWIPAHLSPS